MIISLKALKSLLIDKYENDSWWVAVNGDVRDDTYSLLEIHNIVEDNPECKVSVLHEEDAAGEQWMHLEESNHNVPPVPTKKEVPKESSPLRGLSFNPFNKKPIDLSQSANKPNDTKEKKEEAPATASIVDSKEIQELRSELKAMQTEFKAGLEELKDLKNSLEEREEFILLSEEKLMEKVHEQEHRSTELDQRAEDLHNLEESLKDKK